MDARDGLLQDAWTQEEQPQRHRKLSPLWFAALALALVMSYVLVARAHIHGHSEWDDVISSSTNVLGRPCCGYGDAQLLEFDEWEPAQKGSYRVKIENKWYSVPPRDITQNAANPTGKAIVWWVHLTGQVYIYASNP